MFITFRKMDNWKPDWMKTDHLISITSVKTEIRNSRLGEMEHRKWQSLKFKSAQPDGAHNQKSGSTHKMRSVPCYETIESVVRVFPIRH